ncbi:MAG: hypothetical protein LBC51_04600 [Treponema sp.]|jgi:hypothetical protein|nr:hypothetical protein [Treponema sp.]
MVIISDELKNLLIQTITSWQVMGVSLTLIAYFSLVSYIVRFRPKLKVAAPKKPKPQKEKKAPAKAEDDNESIKGSA